MFILMSDYLIHTSPANTQMQTVIICYFQFCEFCYELIWYKCFEKYAHAYTDTNIPIHALGGKGKERKCFWI